MYSNIPAHVDKNVPKVPGACVQPYDDRYHNN